MRVPLDLTSLITQQPLGGKTNTEDKGLERWKYGHLKHAERLTPYKKFFFVKSDDVAGRTKIYESLVKGDNSLQAGTPQSFNVLMKEMQSLCLDIRVGEDAL